jgi:hypothetical protein
MHSGRDARLFEILLTLMMTATCMDHGKSSQTLPCRFGNYYDGISLLRHVVASLALEFRTSLGAIEAMRSHVRHGNYMDLYGIIAHLFHLFTVHMLNWSKFGHPVGPKDVRVGPSKAWKPFLPAISSRLKVTDIRIGWDVFREIPGPETGEALEPFKLVGLEVFTFIWRSFGK